MYCFELLPEKPVLLDTQSKRVGGSFGEEDIDRRMISLAHSIAISIPGCVYFDIGASTGSFTLLAKYLDGCSVCSFEPNPPIFDILQRNVDLNQLSDCVKLFKLALTDCVTAQTAATLQCPAGEHVSNTGLATLSQQPLRFHCSKIVDIVSDTMDRVTNDQRLTRLDFIKIDTEGSELRILRGGHCTIKKFRPIILLEWNEINLMQCGSSTTELLHFIRNDLQYVCCPVSEQDVLCFPPDASNPVLRQFESTPSLDLASARTPAELDVLESVQFAIARSYEFRMLVTFPWNAEPATNAVQTLRRLGISNSEAYFILLVLEEHDALTAARIQEEFASANGNVGRLSFASAKVDLSNANLALALCDQWSLLDLSNVPASIKHCFLCSSIRLLTSKVRKVNYGQTTPEEQDTFTRHNWRRSSIVGFDTSWINGHFDR